MMKLFAQNWSCTKGSVVTALGTLVVLISLLHISLSPSSTLDYFRVGYEQAPLKLGIRFPADLHNAVVYRDSPWKPHIGSWLSACDSLVADINITEIISGKACKNECSGQGVCNHQLGQCRCFHGYTGEHCFDREHLACNFPSSPDRPYGRWVVSICPADCDTTRAMCFCGEDTKYPYRPVAEACGFTINVSSTPPMTDWGKPDLGVFTTNSSVKGWCNVDPQQAYDGQVKFKEECHCKYDGHIGQFCEIPVISTCINQCSGHGFCRGGFCQCNGGWYGTDCSIPSLFSPIREWPQWLRPAHIDMPGYAHAAESIDTLNAAVAKKRPLIYVYDLPPQFNSLLLEGRHFKFECVNRLYDDRNATVWTEQLYGAQMALYESILASPYRTLNGDEADFFYVPTLDSCIITRADDSPHLSMQDHKGLRSSIALEFSKKAYIHIAHHYPYWNRSSGRDHIWFFSWDEGACYAPKEIWSSIMLVHWGNTNSKHNHSTTAYWADNWDTISPERRGNHPCFDPTKDLVVPAWKRPDEISFRSKLWTRPRDKRKTLFYFNGNLGPAYENGRPEATYSMGIRQAIATEFSSSLTKDGKLGRQHQPDVIVTSMRSVNYYEELASSTFCGVFPGDGWSGRMEDSILQGCIPVIVQDGIFLPYENVLNYDSFAVRVGEDEIPNLIKILRGINETEIEFKLANVQSVMQRFLYRDSILLEAERQMSAFGHVDDWATELLRMSEDDVLATLIQVLHYKLHNESWRKRVPRSKRESGLPQECLIK
ncbi:uncharacterized protein LOC141604650 [Silene latifolia]|uniref:uncharacterized protein LOC141604650 n=1 Tax=Silene latifolia TaxID=37657 RepID=UPI003D779779